MMDLALWLKCYSLGKNDLYAICPKLKVLYLDLSLVFAKSEISAQPGNDGSNIDIA